MSVPTASRIAAGDLTASARRRAVIGARGSHDLCARVVLAPDLSAEVVAQRANVGSLRRFVSRDPAEEPGVIQRKELAAVPRVQASGGLFEDEAMTLDPVQRAEGGRAHRHDHRDLCVLDQPHEPWLAGVQMLHAGEKNIVPDADTRLEMI
jgi:hypothetical protein